MMIITGGIFKGLSLVVFELLVPEFHQCIVEHSLLGWSGVEVNTQNTLDQ